MDKPYIVSARKYRPTSFDTVVGQTHVTETLEHEVTSGNLAQALLFCGPKGVGKTSCARILAKRINEINTDADENYDLNIFELDAASNNKVDDIRQLIDQVRFAPQLGQYKVYIIDEVHMLSTAAFNAFLKTLEEPPAHAIFILATTEKHKVLPTILSRCQVFDFKRIRTEDIVRHLNFVASEEGLQVEQEALHLIAEKADGALRDSLSVFDRICAFSQGQNISYELVRENLQILDRDIYFRTLNDLKNSDVSSLFLHVNSVLERGFDLHIYVSGLANHVRDVLMAKHPSTVDLMEIPDSVKDRYRSQSNEMDLIFLGRALRLLSRCDIQYKDSSSPRLFVEVVLLEIAGLTEVDAKKKKLPAKSEIVPEDINLHKKTMKPLEEKKPPSSATEIMHPPLVQSVSSAKKNTDEIMTGDTIQKVGASNSNVEFKPIKKSAFSLRERNSIQNTDKYLAEKNKLNDVLNIKKLTSFNQTDLVDVWKINSQLMSNRPVIHALLQQISPILEDDFNIRISVGTRVQSDYLESVRDELVNSFRQELKNDSIIVNIQIEESDSNAKIVYTAEERYNFLLEKNPELDEFRKEFQLDID